MSDPSIDTSFEIVAAHITRYRSIRKDLDRIQTLVQFNQEFFGAHLGQSSVEAAANKLEALVREWRQQ